MAKRTMDSGSNKSSKGIAVVGFIFFFAAFLLKLFTVTAFFGIPIIWIGSFVLLIGALTRSPLFIVASIGILAPTYIVDFFIGGALG